MWVSGKLWEKKPKSLRWFIHIPGKYSKIAIQTDPPFRQASGPLPGNSQSSASPHPGHSARARRRPHESWGAGNIPRPVQVVPGKGRKKTGPQSSGWFFCSPK